MVRWLAPAFVQGVLDASPEALKAQAERAARGLQETRIPPIRRRWEDESWPSGRRSTVGRRPPGSWLPHGGAEGERHTPGCASPADL